MNSAERSKLLSHLAQVENNQELPAPKNRYKSASPVQLVNSRSPSPNRQHSPAPLQTDNAHLDRLEAEIARLKEETSRLSAANQGLAAKNDSLVRNQAAAISSNSRDASDRIGILLRENDGLINQNASLEREVSQLQRQLSEFMQMHDKFSIVQQRNADLEAELNEVTIKADNAQMESRRAISQFEAARYDVECLTTELKESRAECAEQSGKVDALQKSLHEIRSRYSQHVLESRAQNAKDADMLSSLKAAEAEIDELKFKNAALKSDYELLDEKHQEVIKVCKSLQSRIEECDDHQLELFQNAQRQTELANEATVEMEKAKLNEQQALAEVRRLETRVLDVQKRFADKTETEIATIRTQFIAEKARLNSQIDDLENSASKMKVMAERAIREKRAAESELEKLTRHIPAESDRLNAILEDLTARLRHVQQDRSEALSKLETITSKNARESEKLQREKASLSESNDIAYKTIRKLTSESQEAREECVKLTKSLSQLDHSYKLLKETFEKARISHSHDMASATSNAEAKISELTEKLAQVSAAHSTTCTELHTLLENHRTLSQKWASESKGMQSHYEALLTDSRDTASRLTLRITQLEDDIDRIERARHDAVTLLANEKRAVANIHARLQDAERKAEVSAQTVRMYVKREGELEAERKVVERDLERALLEQERSQRERISRQRFEGERIVPVVGEGIGVDALWREVARVKQRSCARSPTRRYDIDLDMSDEGEE